ncbi:MAG: DMSO/selenate family reductase complex B subunit [Gordonibacter sp.]|uniref:DMSO/selenate family reductase complex B subunit n=1 Tax=Gordonibacter sp. TaxID=1968902 RepID=UPI002FCC5EF0
MEQHGFHFDTKRCTGCKTCMLSCKDYHDLDPSVSFRQVYEFAGGEWVQDQDGLWRQDCFAFYVSSACNHCSSPACMEVCPTGAMHKNERGLVCVDDHRCIGCGYCALSCPYHAPRVDRSVGHSVKCDGCSDRVDQGLAPICVEACPLRALDFGLMVDMRKRYGALADLPPLPDSGQTAPNLTITLPICMEKNKETVLAQGFVRNKREIV